MVGHDGGVTALAVAERAGRPVIVSGGDDGTVQIWNIDDGSLSVRVVIDASVGALASFLDHLVVGHSGGLTVVRLT